MRTCIYCRTSTNGNEPEDHPALQALGTARALPKGDVCADCNSYLSDLDHHVCNHHHIAGMIAFGQIVGTKKRMRATVSEGFSFDADARHVAIKGARGKLTDGRLDLRLDRTKDFDEWKFSRGFHRMALGILALEQGPDAALNSRFDTVRTYVRRPVGRKIREYSQRMSNNARRRNPGRAQDAARGIARLTGKNRDLLEPRQSVEGELAEQIQADELRMAVTRRDMCSNPPARSAERDLPRAERRQLL